MLLRISFMFSPWCWHRNTNTTWISWVSALISKRPLSRRTTDRLDQKFNLPSQRSKYLSNPKLKYRYVHVTKTNNYNIFTKWNVVFLRPFSVLWSLRERKVFFLAPTEWGFIKQDKWLSSPGYLLVLTVFSQQGLSKEGSSSLQT